MNEAGELPELLTAIISDIGYQGHLEQDDPESAGTRKFMSPSEIASRLPDVPQRNTLQIIERLRESRVIEGREREVGRLVLVEGEPGRRVLA